MRKQYVLFIALVTIVSCARTGDIPVLVPGENASSEIVNIGQGEYYELLDRSLDYYEEEEHFKKNQQDLEMYTKYVVYGLSVDVKVGIGKWSVAPQASVEFHMSQED